MLPVRDRIAIPPGPCLRTATERGQDTGAGRSGGAAENGTVFTQGAESRAQGSDGNATVDVTVAIDGLSKLVKASEDGYVSAPGWLTAMSLTLASAG
jgi:hypothetical protein